MLVYQRVTTTQIATTPKVRAQHFISRIPQDYLEIRGGFPRHAGSKSSRAAQPTNQPTNQPAWMVKENQSTTNQPTNQPAWMVKENQSTNQPTNQLEWLRKTNQPTNQPAWMD